MIKHFTELAARMAVLPFSEKVFLEKMLFQNLINASKEKKYRAYDEAKEWISASLSSEQHVRSLDSLHLLFEQYFPLKKFQSGQSENEIYLEHLNRLSRSFITHRDGKVALKYWKNENDSLLFGAFEGFEKIEVWNTLSRIFCIDILVILHLLNNYMDDPMYLNGYYWLINIGDMQLDKVMERGLAENHIHISAGINFNVIWQNLMGSWAVSADEQGEKKIKNVYFGNPKETLQIASLMRIIMFGYVNSEYHHIPFDQYIFSRYIQGCSDTKDKQRASELQLCMQWFIRREGRIPQVDIQKLYTFITENPEFKNKFSSSYKEPLKAMKNLEHLNTTEENLFLMQILKHLKQYASEENTLFSQLFWQYIRVKNLIYRSVTQGNFMEGLDYFRTFFSAATSLVPKQLEHALRNQIHNNNLKKLEIRVSPPRYNQVGEIRSKLVKDLRIFFETYKNIVDDDQVPYEKMPQIGIVYHLIKTRDETFYEKCWYKDSERRSLLRENHFFGTLQSRYKETVDAINELRESIPGLSRYIVGLDAASVENNTEPWVFAPVFRHARDSRTSKMHSSLNGEKIQTLGFTYHVGEEFRHLLSGLRHIDEVVEHFHYHIGDRIGHGIALGIDVQKWCQDNPVVVMPRVEYMENLLWLWGQTFLEKGDTKLDIDLMGLEREVMTQAEKIYHNIDGINMFMLWKAYKGRFNRFETSDHYIQEVCISETNRSGLWRNESPMISEHFCKQPVNSGYSWNESKLQHANHCKCFLERMYEVIQIAVNESEISQLNQIQVHIRKKLGTKGIVVEANPSSNLAISGINRLFQHPVMNFNTNGLSSQSSPENGVIISINSDDPAVFNTSISNELSYIFYMLQDKGYPRDAILAWIEKIREWGIMTSFIQDRRIDRSELLRELQQIIGHLK